MRRALLALAFLLSLTPALPAQTLQGLGTPSLTPASSSAQVPSQSAHVRANLVLQSWLHEVPRPADGEGIRADLELSIEKGWHVYWRNPGDAGRPVSVKWTLPEGWTADPLQWPVPKLFSTNGLTDYGYEGEVFLTAVLRPPPGVKAKINPAAITAEVSWLVCNPETCLPGRTVVHPSPEPPGTKIYRDDTLLFPQTFPNTEASLREEGDGFRLSLTGEGVAALPQTGALRFLPYEKGIIANGERQFSMRSGSGLELRIKKAVRGDEAAPLSGTVSGLLLAVDEGRGWEIEAKVAPPLPAAPKASGFPWAALGLAFLGGLLLNLMPCVLPVLSLKVLGLVSMPRAEARRHGFAYTAGVLLSFLALAGLLLALRAAGGRFGWGFQLQSPPFVAFVAALFFAIGLNLLGLFEVGEGLAAKGGALLAEKRKGQGFAAPFFGGLLAVVVATPCTAPFMGTALGVAFTQPAFVALLVFAFLGLGLAAPYLLLTLNPAWLRFVPKSGAWMDWFRRILSIPMFATVAWLCWVYWRETGSIVFLLFALAAVFFAAGVFGQWRGREGATRLVLRALALFLVGVSLSLVFLHKPQPAPASSAAVPEGDWQPYSEALLNDLLDAGRPVFVDFTADWCLPCQVNKKVLDGRETAALFKAKGVVRLLADWTRNDPAITAALARAGRESVPLYLLYEGDPAKPPKILPAVLTPSIVAEALGKLSSKP